MQQRGAPLALLLPRGGCLSSPAVTRAYLSASPWGEAIFKTGSLQLVMQTGASEIPKSFAI